MSNKLNEKLASSYQYVINFTKQSSEQFKGEIYPAGTKDIIKFETFDDFILKMDLYMDEHGPQSFQDKRSLTKSTSKSHFVLPNTMSMENDVENAKDLYHLYIFSRRNTEWQGAIYKQDELKLEFSTILDVTSFFAEF